jgi:hypothetical protein
MLKKEKGDYEVATINIILGHKRKEKSDSWVFPTENFVWLDTIVDTIMIDQK